MPMNKQRKPPNWVRLATAKKDAADWCCEYCFKPCFRPGETLEELVGRLDGRWLGVLLLPERPGGPKKLKQQRFRLTVTPLDQNILNHDPGNLCALCAPCKLRHDARHKAANIMSKRERESGQIPLLWAPAIASEPAGNGKRADRVQPGLW